MFSSEAKQLEPLNTLSTKVTNKKQQGRTYRRSLVGKPVPVGR